VLAENIGSDEDYEAVKLMGIAGASRDSSQNKHKADK
jgi:hypothetical protein